jgi:hypothetical protein
MPKTSEDTTQRHNRVVAAIVEEAKLRLPEGLVEESDTKVFSYEEALAIAGFAARVGVYAAEFGSDISVAAQLASGEEVFRRQQPSPFKPILRGDAEWQQ